MRIDASHRRWLMASVGIALAGGLAYGVYAATAPKGPGGGTWPGIAFGLVAAVMILFAGFLGARKKLLLLRIGSLTWWMKGHLWLGLLSLPMVLFHSAFRFGGPLTSVLMVLLLVIVVSGVVGAILQHSLPGVMTAQVAEEQTYEQLERMRALRRRAVYEIVSAHCGEPAEAQDERAQLEAALGEAPAPGKVVQATEGAMILKGLYVTTILPYLCNPRDRSSPLARPTQAMLLFDEVRTRVDPMLHEAIAALAGACEEQRQQLRQAGLHRFLHGWLLLHIPLSMALMVLMIVHAVMALYY